MSTIEILKTLSDGEFHKLCDDLLRRVDVKFRNLRTHGLNDKGESIVGQPDSYIGNTAGLCTIAVCYTVQRKNWWTKVIADVREAVDASTNLTEIIAIIPHNSDREGPKKNINWMQDACSAAAKASFQLIDGREISQWLDSDYQDLRFQYLGLPYSRLSPLSILESARIASQKTIDNIISNDRFDPSHYVRRSADSDIFDLWQQSIASMQPFDRGDPPVRLIALVNDSGVGKTSLVCSFACSLMNVLPVIFIQARDLTFHNEDALTIYIVQSLQGVLAPETRVIEEAAIRHHIARKMPLTIILDGLDESHDSTAVKRSINYWLMSELGKLSVLIITSRPEFWKICYDPSWHKWMPENVIRKPEPYDSYTEEQLPSTRRMVDRVAKIPELFSDADLEAAWLLAGLSSMDLYAMSKPSRYELRHPFTLKIYLDLLSKTEIQSNTMERHELIGMWLNNRLDAEAIHQERLTRHQFHDALQIIAQKISSSNSNSIDVDSMAEVPRFDIARPPGPVVERLIAANILESIPNRSDKIRFTIEAVQDFYLAEADIKKIQIMPKEIAEEFSRARFTETYPRLRALGQRIVETNKGIEFVERLAELSPHMAAAVIQSSTSKWPKETRRRVIEALSRAFSQRYRVKTALAISMLGDIDCDESIGALTRNLIVPEFQQKYFQGLASLAFIKLGHAAEYVYSYGPFNVWNGCTVDYYRRIYVLLKNANSDFRIALGNFAIGKLNEPSNTKPHAKAIQVLAYLDDCRIVDHLSERLSKNGALCFYENQALVMLGTNSAGKLFSSSIRNIAKQSALLQSDTSPNSEHAKLFYTVAYSTSGFQFKISQEFELHLKKLIQSDEENLKHIAFHVANSYGSPTLLLDLALINQRTFWMFSENEKRKKITPELWIDYWRKTTDHQARNNLLRLRPIHPNIEVEELIIESLDHEQLRSAAADALGDYGSVRAMKRLRDILNTNFESSSCWAVTRAIGDLRDVTSIPLLSRIVQNCQNIDVSSAAAYSLGVIGGIEAEVALTELLNKNKMGNESVATAMLMCGTSSAVITVIQHSKQKNNPGDWICEQAKWMSANRGHRPGEYKYHFDTSEFVDSLEFDYKNGKLKDTQSFFDAFRHVDGASIRDLFANLLKLKGSEGDVIIRENNQFRLSNACMEELEMRGDERVLPYILNSRATETDDRFYVHITSTALRRFTSKSVSSELINRLKQKESLISNVRIIALLGKFGDVNDAFAIEVFLDDNDDYIANIAFESYYRLTDPLLIPEDWREI